MLANKDLNKGRFPMSGWTPQPDLRLADMPIWRWLWRPWKNCCTWRMECWSLANHLIQNMATNSALTLDNQDGIYKGENEGTVNDVMDERLVHSAK